MNIFYTSDCPQQAAENLCMVHINKMIIESAQVLSTAHRLLDGSEDEALYKATHVNHPSSVWVRQSVSHYMWLYQHMAAMMGLYTKVRGKVHGTEDRCLDVLSEIPKAIPVKPSTQPPICMPDEYKVGGVCKSYQNYLGSKYAEWRSRAKPIKVDYPLGKPNWLEV